MKKNRFYFKYNDEINKMLDEIIEERNKEYNLIGDKEYTITNALQESIIFAHEIIVSKKFEFLPNRKLWDNTK